jgi:caa(3)-type oxidase subunit IV
MSDTEQHEHHVDLNSYIRRCAWVFVTALCMIGLMIFASYLPNIGWPLKVTIILAIAICNAFVVAGFLMHLLTEKKMVYTVLSFTVFFFAGLMGLTLWAMNNFPVGTAVH